MLLPTALNMDRSVVRKRLKKWVIDPRESKRLFTWDVVTTIALVYTMLLTPFEVAFVDAPKSADTFWFISNRLIDAIFITDVGSEPRLACSRQCVKQACDANVQWPTNAPASSRNG